MEQNCTKQSMKLEQCINGLPNRLRWRWPARGGGLSRYREVDAVLSQRAALCRTVDRDREARVRAQEGLGLRSPPPSRRPPGRPSERRALRGPGGGQDRWSRLPTAGAPRAGHVRLSRPGQLEVNSTSSFGRERPACGEGTGWFVERAVRENERVGWAHVRFFEGRAYFADRAWPTWPA
eukprot:scaffold79385_cov64-Phaeocystis_antarctica.AAC.3